MAYEIMGKRGVAQHYGPRHNHTEMGGRQVANIVKRASWEFDYKTLPTPGLNNLQQVIPANSVLINAYLIPTVTWAGGTSLSVGLVKKDGTGGSATAVYAATNLTVAGNKLDKGTIQTADGAYIKKTIGADPLELKVTAVGTMSDGAARLILEYVTL